VTIDAMGCQRNIASKITEKNADYIIALKANQGTCARMSRSSANLVLWHRKHLVAYRRAWRRKPLGVEPRAFRDHLHLQHGDRLGAPAGRAQPVRALDHLRRADRRSGFAKGSTHGPMPPISRCEPRAPDRRQNSEGTGVVGILQADESRVGQDRSGPGNPAEQDRAFFIDNR
jgi:hypothetical protein